MSLTVKPLTQSIGVEVTGADLSTSVPKDAFDTMKQALRDHLVMVVRDQTLGPAQLLAAARLFGETMEQHLTDVLMAEHPEIALLDSRAMPPDQHGRLIPFGGRDWHTDHTNHARPPKYTLLYAVKLPSSGGDTSFANMHDAYAFLEPEEQQNLAALKTVNTIEDFAYISDDAREKFGTLPVHPLVRTHPETGRKALYVHPGKLDRIEGREPEESRAFVDALLDRVIRPENTYRHKWRPGDLLFCDNRAVLHVAHKDYDMTEGRVMQRILLQGDVPV
ncbi:MAG: TauD/TfdA family dioxygenase [Rickettsiales bacterium]